MALGSTVIFVVEELITVEFNDHFHAFMVNATGQLSVIESADLKDHHPLAIQQFQIDNFSLRLIAPRYKIV